jgi:hypothetical protein
MKRLSVVLCVLLISAAPARAFVPQWYEDAANGVSLQAVRWPEGTNVVPLMLNNQALQVLPSIVSSSTPVAAIQAALHTWAVAPLGMYYAGAADAANVGADGVNLITFADTPTNRDVVSDRVAVTATFLEYRSSNLVRITEADVVFSPKVKFATDGRASAQDIQGTLTHELGHVLGLDHSPILTASMFPYVDAGNTAGRQLERDDLAGMWSLYGGPQGLGRIAGHVTTNTGRAVFGAHVVAVDASGVIQVGAVTDQNGQFLLSSLPGGDYQVYAEPLDQPFTGGNLISDYFHAAGYPLQTAFLTTFAGGNAAPAVVHVAAGGAGSLPSLVVDAKSPKLNPDGFAWSKSLSSWKAEPGVVQVAPGGRAYLFVVGAWTRSVPNTGYSFSGAGIGINQRSVQRATATDGTPGIVLPLLVDSDAPPGARSMFVDNGAERAALTGCVKVSAP